MIYFPVTFNLWLYHLQNEGMHKAERSMIATAGINEYPINDAKHVSVIPSSPQNEGVNAITTQTEISNAKSHKISNRKISANIQFQILVTYASSDPIFCFASVYYVNG